MIKLLHLHYPLCVVRLDQISFCLVGVNGYWMKESFVANLKDRSEKEVWFVVIFFDFVTLISCFLLMLLHDCFLANLRVIRVTASCSSLGTRLFKMSFAYRDLLHFSDNFVILVWNNYYFSFYVIPTNKLMQKRRA